MRSQRIAKQYELDYSPFYKLASKRKLAELLRIDLCMLSGENLSNLISQYRIFVDPISNRFITEPVKDLLLIHKRLLKLLCRIKPRNYVHSATKKRSYKTNAEQHLQEGSLVKIDIKKFFPSVQFCYVHSFFANTLCCSTDIATILAKLCTVKTSTHGTHLPTGSCISPILSFLVNRALFDRIESLCKEANCIFTLYVDDITISGKGASKELLSQVANLIFNFGYKYHKVKSFQGGPAIVTGLIIRDGKLSLPFERQMKIRNVASALSFSNGQLREKLLSSLIGRLAEAEHIDASYRRQKVEVMRQYSAEWRNIVKQRAEKAKQAAAKRATSHVKLRA